MEKIRQYLVLLLKEMLKKKSEWLHCGLLLIVLVVLCSFCAIDKSKPIIGIVFPKTEIAQEIVDNIGTMQTTFEVLIYEDEKALIEDELNGSIDCGFLFCNDFDKKISSGDIHDMITYSYTPFTSKGSIAKEYVFSAVLKKYSLILLNEKLGDCLVDTEQTASLETYLAERSEEYLNSDMIFHIELYNVNGNEIVSNQVKDRKNLLRGLTGILLFAAIQFSFLGEKKKRYFQFLELLDKANRRYFLIAAYFVTVLLPAIVCTVFMVLYDQETTFIFQILKLITFLLVSGIYGAFLWRFHFKSDTLMIVIVLLCLMQLVIVPVFVDLSTWVPAIRLIRYLMPLAYYL